GRRAEDDADRPAGPDGDGLPSPGHPAGPALQGPDRPADADGQRRPADRGTDLIGPAKHLTARAGNVAGGCFFPGTELGISHQAPRVWRRCAVKRRHVIPALAFGLAAVLALVTAIRPGKPFAFGPSAEEKQARSQVDRWADRLDRQTTETGAYVRHPRE